MDDITDALDAERQVFDTEFTELRRGVLQRIDVMAEDLRAFPPMPMREKIDTARRWIADEFDATFDRILVSDSAATPRHPWETRPLPFFAASQIALRPASKSRRADQ